MNETRYSEKWAEIGQSVIDEYADSKFKLIKEYGLCIGYVLSDDAPMSNGVPKLAECIPVKKDHARQFTPHDFLIKLYVPNASYMTPQQLRILMEHELMHIKVYEDGNGELKLGSAPHDVQDFSDIISKYGMDWAKDMRQMTIDDIAYEDADDDEENDEEGSRIECNSSALPEGETA